jgi:predicted transcriptional regulator
MTNTKRETIKATIAQGLASANKGNVFWTKADAMQSFAAFHKSAK